MSDADDKHASAPEPKGTLPSMQPGERFPATSRIKSRNEFERVFKKGRVAADSVLVLHGIRNQVTKSRLGLSISKRVGSAPIRNRWKRLIREAFRTQQLKLPQGLDLVARPKRGAVADCKEIRKSIIRLAHKLQRRL